MNLNLIGQGIGIFAVVVSLLVFQQPTPKRMSAYKFAADILWIAHFLLIGAYTGMYTTGIAVFREIVLINRKKHPVLDKKIWLVLFCILFCSALIFTWKNIFSLFPVTASCIATAAFWKKEAASVRKLSLVVSALMLVYGIASLSVSAIINETITVASIFVAFIRYNNTAKKLKI